MYNISKCKQDRGYTMKRFFALFLLLTLAAWALPGAAQEAEMISGCGITVDKYAEKIDFGKVQVTNTDDLIRLIDQMPNLKVVDMYSSSIKKPALEVLFDMYPQITFGWTYYVGDHKVRTDITAFSTLHGSSPDPVHTEKDFKYLRFCKNLQAIDVGHNWVKDISWLTNFPHLKVLILGVNRVSDLSPLAELKELEYIELFTNTFTDLTPLMELTNLRDLNIKNNPVTDISPLYKMPWLERLWLGMNKMDKIPAEERAALQLALPNCEIDWIHKPTAGTWREHPHYDTIYSMFRSRIYTPFDQ